MDDLYLMLENGWQNKKITGLSSKEIEASGKGNQGHWMASKTEAKLIGIYIR